MAGGITGTHISGETGAVADSNAQDSMLLTHDGILSGLSKSSVGLANVDNTADVSKAVLSATKLATARTIAGKSFDGQANITIAPSDVGAEPAITAGSTTQYLRGDKSLATFLTTMTGLGGAFLVALGLPYTIYIDGTTGVWPNSGARTIPSGYSGRVIWDSQAYPAASVPAGMIDGDFLDDRVA